MNSISSVSSRRGPTGLELRGERSSSGPGSTLGEVAVPPPGRAADSLIAPSHVPATPADPRSGPARDDSPYLVEAPLGSAPAGAGPAPAGCKATRSPTGGTTAPAAAWASASDRAPGTAPGAEPAGPAGSGSFAVVADHSLRSAITVAASSTRLRAATTAVPRKPWCMT